MADLHTPDNWTVAAEPVEPGPSVLVDVDGVISDGWHRQHHLQNGKKDWKSFFADAHLDVPVEGSIELLDQFDADLRVVLLTARPHTIHTITLGWIVEHRFRWDMLVMRGRRHGHLSSPEFKRQSLTELRSAGFEPTLAIDDDQRNIDMFRDEGIAALYVHSGYYEV